MKKDDLTRLIRSARPELPIDDATIDARKAALFDRIVGDEPSDELAARRVRRAPVRLIFSVAAVFVILVLLGAGTFLVPRPGQAFAVTPPVLQAEPLSSTAKEVLMDAADQLIPTSGEPPRTFSYRAWQLQSTDPGNGALSSVVQPAEITVSTAPDGSVSRIARATVPYPEDAGTVRPGDELWRLEYAPGEYQPVFPDPPTDAAAVGEYLARYGALPEEPTSGDYILAIQMLLTERTLASTEEAALLRFVASLPDLMVNGTVTDRLGRQGVSVSTTSRAPGEFIDSLIVSPAGAGILSSEMTYIGSDRTDIASPAIVLYYAWEK
ncbi:hypothetical protein [Agromyces atrinae]|uniref:CU044_5270 family protein n=1 Tax=Agromyces atrinae TaxID=592376 RepID=A0A4Q2MBC9_9MICO|nr:hypothetical protein [Agromyces atrinae]NYD66042.1 hypothetical protein [Agromyces atrinae]RXZ86370.1 hypothetical protein ESP50_11480 [Agromyces atrinae]